MTAQFFSSHAKYCGVAHASLRSAAPGPQRAPLSGRAFNRRRGGGSRQPTGGVQMGVTRRVFLQAAMAATAAGAIGVAETAAAPAASGAAAASPPGDVVGRIT